jgi:ABC-type Fe3+-siderophore transport system permease subunit
VIIISVIIAILALFGAYYQRFLFKNLLDPHEYQVSGWVFFGVISSSAIARFFLFNVQHIYIPSMCKI